MYANVNKPDAGARSVACPLRKREAQTSILVSGSFFRGKKSILFKESKLSVTGERIGSEYWSTVSWRLAQEQRR